MAHLAVALPNIACEQYAADIIGPFFHTRHAHTTGCVVTGGTLTVPDGPGLGVNLDRDQLEALRDDRAAPA
jgi:L-alanine-DL-glutamate epimerase-like enolase superfamily enzyme